MADFDPIGDALRELDAERAVNRHLLLTIFVVAWLVVLVSGMIVCWCAANG